jgi:hypothetical protein
MFRLLAALLLIVHARQLRATAPRRGAAFVETISEVGCRSAVVGAQRVERGVSREARRAWTVLTGLSAFLDVVAPCASGLEPDRDGRRRRILGDRAMMLDPTRVDVRNPRRSPFSRPWRWSHGLCLS